MAFTYDLSNPTDMTSVRLLIGDTIDSGHLFEDAEIVAFLTMSSDQVLLAAARALDTMAASQVMILKVIHLHDLSTDGAAVGRELRQQAAGLRTQHAEEVAATEDVDGLFDWAEFELDIFSRRELALNRALRGYA